MRLCKNVECRRPIDPERVEKYDAETCDSKCRAAAWKQATGYGRPAARVDRANGASRSGRQLSYRKTIAVVTDVLAGYMPAHRAQVMAENALRDALPERQRKTGR